MTNPVETLFGASANLLSHTLAHAGNRPEGRTVRLSNGVTVELLDVGILRVRPPLIAERQLIVSAGVHGNETVPIEVCSQLVGELLDEAWTPATATLILLGNPEAMARQERFLDFNLNRLFAGEHRHPRYRGIREADRAARLESVVSQFVENGLPLFHYDLHTAIRPSEREKFALYPYVAGRQVPEQQLQFLRDCDVATVLLQHKVGTTFSSWTSSEFGAQSFTVELGQVRPFGQNELSRFRGIKDGLRKLMRGQWPMPVKNIREEVTQFRVVCEILHSGEHFRFHVPDDVANFTEYPPGALIWEDQNQRYLVGENPEAIVFPNRNVPVGQRVGLLVRKVDPGTYHSRCGLGFALASVAAAGDKATDRHMLSVSAPAVEPDARLRRGFKRRPR